MLIRPAAIQSEIRLSRLTEDQIATHRAKVNEARLALAGEVKRLAALAERLQLVARDAAHACACGDELGKRRFRSEIKQLSAHLGKTDEKGDET